MGLAHGIFGWADVAVPDTDAGAAFYSALFGWEAIDGGGGEAMPYTMFASDGKLVAGMGLLSKEDAEAGQPPMWSSYIMVDDADAAHAKAVELGATPVMPVMDIMDAGRMFFILDPVGAMVGFWESGTHDGAQVFNVPSAMTWNDLATRDVGAAKDFYTRLVGWEAEDLDMGGTTYTMFSNADRSNGGVWDMAGSFPDEMPSHWMAWFLVDDASATTARVTELGGSVVRKPNEGGGLISALVQDPSGATFGVVQSDQTDGQPPT
jgi:predicted enzyme related to lactoylglutathione lyase